MHGPSYDDLVSLAAQLLAQLEHHGLTLAVAESITGGLIGHALTETPGASNTFLGGVLCYDNRLKERIGVSPETLARHGAVSEETAREMAKGIRHWAGADIGLAVTGIAGPTGATEQKPVGLTYIAVADETGAVWEKHIWTEDRWVNKRNTAAAALRLALRRLTETPA